MADSISRFILVVGEEIDDPFQQNVGSGRLFVWGTVNPVIIEVTLMQLLEDRLSQCVMAEGDLRL